MCSDILSLRMSDCLVCGKKCRVWQMELAQKKTPIILLFVSRSQNFLKTQEKFATLLSSMKKKIIQKCVYFWYLWQLTPSISTWLEYVLQEILTHEEKEETNKYFHCVLWEINENNFLRKYFCHQEKSPCTEHWIALFGKMEQTITHISRLVSILLPTVTTNLETSHHEFSPIPVRATHWKTHLQPCKPRSQII